MKYFLVLVASILFIKAYSQNYVGLTQHELEKELKTNKDLRLYNIVQDSNAVYYNYFNDKSGGIFCIFIVRRKSKICEMVAMNFFGKESKKQKEILEGIISMFNENYVKVDELKWIDSYRNVSYSISMTDGDYVLNIIMLK